MSYESSSKPFNLSLLIANGQKSEADMNQDLFIIEGKQDQKNSDQSMSQTI